MKQVLATVYSVNSEKSTGLGRVACARWNPTFPLGFRSEDAPSGQSRVPVAAASLYRRRAVRSSCSCNWAVSCAKDSPTAVAITITNASAATSIKGRSSCEQGVLQPLRGWSHLVRVAIQAPKTKVGVFSV